MPTKDTGAPQFVAAHPTWDGRGIKIGILDLGVDLGHPALQTTSTGERKVIDWLTFTDPLTDGDPSWINMNQTVSVVGGTSSFVITQVFVSLTAIVPVQSLERLFVYPAAATSSTL